MQYTIDYMTPSLFEEAYKKLNTEQRKVVDTIDGPVMVIAGPGTGKTQVLALRIANILKKTDIGASGILCLTFTRSGVTAMRERLLTYIGADAHKVIISTFHGYAQRLVETHFELLGFVKAPEILDDHQSVVLIDELLYAHEWKFLRPRANPGAYFNDIKALVSVVKREGISPDVFLEEVEHEIVRLQKDPASISSRGETKGQLKKEIQTKIESFEKTKEVVALYRFYEAVKKDRALVDYDDVLQYAVQLVTDYEDVCEEIRVNSQYVLVDEHQDSSGIQNAFLTAVWKEVESPNIFVVGDDRQLIYGFGGASMGHFTNFLNTFKKTELITLVENYRSTKPILNLADMLLQSELAQESLKSNHKLGDTAEKVTLGEYQYGRDEILAAGMYFKQRIQEGVPAQDCALLVPKNYQVKSAVQILEGLGLQVSGSSTESLFSALEYAFMRKVFGVIQNPSDAALIAGTLFDPRSGIPPLEAHAFLTSLKPREFTINDLVSHGSDQGLFAGENAIARWGDTLQKLVTETSGETIVTKVAMIGNSALVLPAKDHDSLVRSVEVIRTLIHIATSRYEKNPHETMEEFLIYLDRLESYGSAIPLATIGVGEGVRVMTLHGSKGLEFEHVWIAHMNQSALMSQRRLGISVPDSIADKIEEKDELVARREVYVAITRAKTTGTLSYAILDTEGATLELAHILSEIPNNLIHKKSIEETTKELVSLGESIYTEYHKKESWGSASEQLQVLVKDHYKEKNVSVTLLNNFFECPWKWYFRNLLQMPEIKSSSLIFGSAVHQVLELVVREKKPLAEKQIREMVRKALVREFAEEHEIEQMTNEGTECILRFIELSFKELAKDRISERSLSYRDKEFPGFSFYGKIDLTERFPDGSVSVTDFKTGSSKTVGVIEKRDEEGRMSDYLRQLAMYSYLINGAEKGTQVVQSQLYFLEAKDTDKNRIYRTMITNEHDELLKKDITDYQRLVDSGEWIHRPCNAKPFGVRDGECEFCKMAKIYKA